MAVLNSKPDVLVFLVFFYSCSRMLGSFCMCICVSVKVIFWGWVALSLPVVAENWMQWKWCCMLSTLIFCYKWLDRRNYWKVDWCDMYSVTGTSQFSVLRFEIKKQQLLLEATPEFRIFNSYSRHQKHFRFSINVEYLLFKTSINPIALKMAKTQWS